MCVVKRTNVTFDVEDPNELAVYEAVQNQPHKMRSKYLLGLAYIGLMNSGNNDAITDIRKDIEKLIRIVSSGIRLEATEPTGIVTDADEMDIYDIDESALADMLGFDF